MDFASQSEKWLAGLRARRDPVKRATLDTWQSIVRTHIVPALGPVLLKDTDNQTLREFVDKLCEKKLSPRTIRDVLRVAKMILRSATDERGNFLYRNFELNHEHINAPSVPPSNPPAANRKVIEEAIHDCPQFAMLFALGAATGMRLGELLSIEIQDDGKNTCWDKKESLIRVRQSAYRGSLQRPKTVAAVREIDICAEMNQALVEFAKNRTGFLFGNGKPMSAPDVYKYGLAKTRIEGAHSLRRFRATRLEEIGAPEPLRKYWLGHAKKDITELYGRLSTNLALRREWAERAGLGFNL